jgi:PAS domain S-box-containing protein
MGTGFDADASGAQGRGHERDAATTTDADNAVMVAELGGATSEVGQFAESYATFNRIINSLQRKYIELEEQFTSQNDELVKANRKLVELSERNLVATEFLNSILNSISAGVVAVDEKQCITHANPAAGMILGRKAEDMLGHAYQDVIDGGTDSPASAVRTAQTGEEVVSVEKEARSANGTRLRLSVSTSVLRNRAGEGRGAVEVFQDLTKIKKMEQELARLNTLAALGEMAATVAHEVRNPLAGIAGFAALLERDLDETDPNRRTVRKIIRGVETLNETVATLLNYTRFKEISRVAVDYPQFVADVIERFRIDNSDRLEQVTIECSTPGDFMTTPIVLEVDATLLRQVFFNIISNAVDMTDGRGRIRIAFRILPPEEAAAKFGDKVLLGPNETIVETTIEDNGPGIHEHHRDRIFAPFFSTRSGGNGLGLAVVWKIMKAHGGEVFVTDAAPSGAAFHLLLPARMDLTTMERRK